MKLSVCMKVRNEEANLPRCLDSVRAVADEILVVDTGSTDRTIEIAQSYGARVIHQPWKDDHSAPHNFGWDHAKGEWLLWLDADESLVESSIPHLRQCLTRRDIGAWYIDRQEINDTNNPGHYAEMILIRLHRRDLPARFTGRYHCQIVVPQPGSPDAGRWTAARSAIKLQHWRWQPDPLARVRRAAKIMSEELRDEPDNLYIMVELANAYNALGDPQGHELMRQAARRLRPADPRPPTVVVAFVLEALLAVPAEAQAVGLRPGEVESMIRRWFPSNAPLKWSLAQRSFAAQDYEAAAAELEALLKLLRDDAHDKLIPFDPRAQEDAQFNLGVCLTRLARLDEAEPIFRGFVNNPRRSAAAAANLEVITRLRSLNLE